MTRRPEASVPLLTGEQSTTVQSLLLRAPRGPAVRHLILRIPDDRGLAARKVLMEAGFVSFGIPDQSDSPTCSVGFTFAGLEALQLPRPYLRVLQRLAPAFREGAVCRSAALGDSGQSSASNWLPGFQHEHAHVIVTWHGNRERVDMACRDLRSRWHDLATGSQSRPNHPACLDRNEYSAVLEGERLGAPPNKVGQWVHFGFRDDVSDLAIDCDKPPDAAPDLRSHAPGSILLGWMDDEGLNRFSLIQAPEKVRSFFLSSSFGILRPMQQDIGAFESQVAKWQQEISRLFEPAAQGETTDAEPRSPAHDQFLIDKDFVKAKLCGRWPEGYPVRPGQTRPPKGRVTKDEFKLELFSETDDGRFLPEDRHGEGCPFGSHVRRMQGRPDQQGHLLLRPLLRRSVPFGSAAWERVPTHGESQGQIGHFFCGSIENQFEHLLGQWGARSPLGAAAGDDAPDPLIGPQDDTGAGMAVPLEDKMPQRLTGFRSWTRTLGMAYAWYPGRGARQMLFEDDFVPVELAGPWL